MIVPYRMSDRARREMFLIVAYVILVIVFVIGAFYFPYAFSQVKDHDCAIVEATIEIVGVETTRIQTEASRQRFNKAIEQLNDECDLGIPTVPQLKE